MTETEWLAEWAAAAGAYETAIEDAGYQAAAVEGMTAAEFSETEGETL